MVGSELLKAKRKLQILAILGAAAIALACVIAVVEK